MISYYAAASTRLVTGSLTVKNLMPAIIKDSSLRDFQGTWLNVGVITIKNRPVKKPKVVAEVVFICIVGSTLFVTVS